MISAEKISGKRAIQGGIALMSLLAAVACSSPVKGEAQMGDGLQSDPGFDCAFSMVLTPEDSNKIVSGDVPNDLRINLDPAVAGVMEELDVIAQLDDYTDEQHANQLVDQSMHVADGILSDLYADIPEADIVVYTDVSPELTDMNGNQLLDGERLVQAVYANCPQPVARS